MTTPEPRPSLYVHVPFCRTRCGYCDFHTAVLRPARVTPLVDALVRELDGSRPPGDDGFETVFVGGGTPTVLPIAELRRLLAAVHGACGAEGPAEYTVEANPATVTEEVAEVLTGAGVDRISIGAQSFEPAELRVLDRMHVPEDVARTVAIARAAGLTNVSLDLIFGVPGQSLASWRRSVERALELEPMHLSCYGLTYEAGTPLTRRREEGRVTPVDPDLEAEMYERTMDWLEAAGLRQYEISNFARRGFECRHNVRCWRNEPYIGVGPSAAGYVGGVRYRNVPDTEAYIAAVLGGRSARFEEERLTGAARAREAAMLALRTVEGIATGDFRRRYGIDPEALFADAIRRHAEAGLLEVSDGHIRLTRAGRLLADTVMADFL